MEKLIYVALGVIVISALVVGFLAGAVGNLFGASFWPVAGVGAALVVAFGIGAVARA